MKGPYGGDPLQEPYEDEDDKDEFTGVVCDHSETEDKLIEDLFLAVMEFCNERSLPIAEYLDRSAIYDILSRMSGEESHT